MNDFDQVMQVIASRKQDGNSQVCAPDADDRTKARAFTDLVTTCQKCGSREVTLRPSNDSRVVKPICRDCGYRCVIVVER